jgi:hypothetical protein
MTALALARPRPRLPFHLHPALFGVAFVLAMALANDAQLQGAARPLALVAAFGIGLSL